MGENVSKREVTEEELKAHVAAWPRPLVRDVARICEPPLVSYNDFTLGNWPESIVASYSTGCWLDKSGNRVPEHDANWTIYRELPAVA